MIITASSCVHTADGNSTLTLCLSSGAHSEKRTLRLLTEEFPAYLHRLPVTISEEQFLLLEEASERCEAFCGGLRILAYGDNTTAALRTKLRRRHFSDDAVAFAVSRIAELGYLDDDALLRDAVLHSANDKLYGSRRIEAEMRAKGFSSEQIREALSVCAPSIDTEQNKRQLILRKFGHSRPETREEALKMKSLLYRYGY